jgi:hypothetical protein
MGRYPFIILCLLGGAKETDLIYEGIATHTGKPYSARLLSKRN